MKKYILIFVFLYIVLGNPSLSLSKNFINNLNTINYTISVDESGFWKFMRSLSNLFAIIGGDPFAAIDEANSAQQDMEEERRKRMEEEQRIREQKERETRDRQYNN